MAQDGGDPKLKGDLGAARRRAHALRDVLIEEIIDGALPPGAHLDEKSLAERFRVSRTPIREALLGLESSGLVELRPRRGAYVRQLGARELFEMFETMGELEAACGRLACARIEPEEEAALSLLLERCEAAAAANDLERYYDENELFHRAIYAAAGNGFLAKQARALQARLKPFRSRQLRARGRIAQSLAEHRAIVKAILAGDGPSAERALRDHVVVQGEKFAALIASLEAPGPTRRAG